MISRTLIAAAATLVVTLSVGAQTQKVTMEHTPVSCIRAGELPLMQVEIEGEGELRAYFRRINTTDWCSVEGTNMGPLSRVVLPKFELGDEIEYFLVVIQGRRVVARSPRIYRARVTVDCELPWARHNFKLALSCGNEVNAIPSSLGAGYAVENEIIEEDPEFATPDRPRRVRTTNE